MNKNHLINHWYAYIYEQQVIQDDVDHIIKVIGTEPKKILEVACGGGRISVPLAKIGHEVTGFDCDDYMLEKMSTKAKGLKNLKFYKADAITQDWGSGFDVVILAGNVLLNIVSDMDYQQSQELFIKKAANCVKQGGYLYLDFDCYDRADETSDEQNEWICFEGTDDLGTYGKYIVVSGEYDSKTRIDKSYRRYEITPKDGESFVELRTSVKHFPTFTQVNEWLRLSGLQIERLLANGVETNSVDRNAHFVVWAKKTLF